MARPGCAPRASTAQRPAMRGGRGGSFWGRGPGSFARCLPRLCLRRARRPDGRHFARRPRLGRWRLPLAGREEGGGRRWRPGGGEAGVSPPAVRLPPAWTPLAGEASTVSSGSEAASDSAPDSGGPRRHEAASPVCWAAGAFPSPSRSGACGQGPRGRSGPRLLRSPRKPPRLPGLTLGLGAHIWLPSAL